MLKQKFYILGHNPNTLQEALDFMKAGANALEPDICYDADTPDRYFVSHGTIGSNAFIAENSLVTYLTGLKQLITEPSNNFNLALIAFDIKTPTFDINEFVRIVFDNFSRFPVCEGVAILITVGALSDIAFLNAYDQTKENVAVGVDGESSPGGVAAGFKAGAQKKIVYANGSIVPAIKFGLFKSIMEAKGVQAAAGGDGFKLVYAWVLNSESSLRSYLDLHIDGVIVDQDTVTHLLEILSEERFGSMYELARNGYNPFAAPRTPTYLLNIKTSDTHRAGTDAHLKFTLEGSAGTLESVLDGDYRDILERGGTDFLTLEGEDIGDIRSLTVEALDSGLYSGWLPASVRLESNLTAAPLTFQYGEDEWVMFGHPVTKTPAG